MLVTELKSEALKERHWKQLMRNLRVAWQLHDLTLGQVWAVDLQRNEAIVKDVILVAQGEMALEEFLKMVCFCASACTYMCTYNIIYYIQSNMCVYIYSMFFSPQPCLRLCQLD